MNDEIKQLLTLQFKHIENLQNTVNEYQQIIIDLINKLQELE